VSTLITSSRRAAFRACPRKHQYLYVDLLIPTRSLVRNRDWGTVFHLACEQYHEGDASDEAIEFGVDAIVDSQLEAFDKAACEIVFRHYAAHWGPLDRTRQCLGAEVQFEAPLINPDSLSSSRLYREAGKMDALVRADDGIWVMEHKTTTADITPGSTYWLRLDLDAQVSTYIDGAKTLGHDVMGMIYDVIKRPTLEPLKATPVEKQEFTQGKGCRLCGGGKAVKGDGCAACGDGWVDPPRLYANLRAADETIIEYVARIDAAITADRNAWFQRGNVVRIGNELQAARRDTWQQMRALHQATKDGTGYRNPDACSKFGNLCEYFDLCTGRASYGQYKRAESAHSELRI
jgi:hypothetical protein